MRWDNVVTWLPSWVARLRTIFIGWQRPWRGMSPASTSAGRACCRTRAMKVRWSPGEVARRGLTVDKIKADLKAAELPMTPALPGQKVVEDEFLFHFRPGDPLEPNCAVAD